MKNSNVLRGCITVILAALSVAAYTQSPPDNGGGLTHMAKADGMSAPTSQEFVTKAAESNMAEIKVSQLALTKTQNADVRSFAQRMIADHEKAGAQLTPLARAHNLKVPDDADMMHKGAMKLLQAKSGASFDTSYIDQMNKDHEKAVTLFESAATSDKVDKDLQAFASETLPTLKEHHALVSKLEANKSAAADH